MGLWLLEFGKLLNTLVVFLVSFMILLSKRTYDPFEITEPFFAPAATF